MLTQHDLQSVIQQANQSDDYKRIPSVTINASESIDLVPEIKLHLLQRGYCIIQSGSEARCNEMLQLLDSEVGPDNPHPISNNP